MSTAGISVGGAGGAGGVDPMKQVKSLDNLGQASKSDVAAFQDQMGGGQPSNMGGVQPGGPFEIQSNRITDGLSVKSKEGGIGNAVLKDVGNLLNAGKAQGNELKAKLDQMGKGNWGPADAMEFQYMAGEMNLMTEVVSKGVNKVVQAAQTVIKNQ